MEVIDSFGKQHKNIKILHSHKCSAYKDYQSTFVWHSWCLGTNTFSLVYNSEHLSIDTTNETTQQAESVSLFCLYLTLMCNSTINLLSFWKHLYWWIHQNGKNLFLSSLHFCLIFCCLYAYKYLYSFAVLPTTMHFKNM